MSESVFDRFFFFASVYVTVTSQTPEPVILTPVFVMEHTLEFAGFTFFGTEKAALVTFFKPSSFSAAGTETILPALVTGFTDAEAPSC